MEDCYKILGVARGASIAEIKRAYRKKAKEFHPDLAAKDPIRQKKNAQEFQRLVKAYQILSDAKQRSFFDVSFSAYSNWKKRKQGSDGFDYRTWLLERNDEESLCKLIFFDLLHNREDEACRRYKDLNCVGKDFKLSRYFTREEFMDYGFILAEELFFRSEYYDAAILLEQIIRMEYGFNYFRLFFPEVIKLVMNIYRNHIYSVISDELAIDVYERALELDFGSENDVFFLTMIANCYRRIGDIESAKICAQKAAELEVKNDKIKKRKAN